MSQLVLNIEGTPKGTEIEVVGLGLFPNGETSTLTAEQCDAYKRYCDAHGKEFPGWPLYLPAKTAAEPKTTVVETTEVETTVVETPVVTVEDKDPVDGNKKGTK